MIAGRPVRTVLAAAALAVVGGVTLVAIVGPTISSLIECGPLCSPALDVPAVVGFATPFASLALAIGLLIRPAVATRPAAVAAAVLALGWIGPVAQNVPPALAMLVTLALLTGTPFLLVTPVGPGAGRWTRRLWIATIVAALALWVSDAMFSGFMQTVPVEPQLAFLGVAAVVLGAGLGSGFLGRNEAGRPAS